MSIEQLFFELLRVSIGVSGCLSKTPTNEEWKALYDMAKKQSLVGVCFAGVQMLVNQHQEPPEMLYLTWMGMAAKIQQRNEVVNQQCEEVQKMLAEKGFRSCIFKGQAVASLYHSSLSALRQSGDIDIWIEGGRERVIELVQSISPTNDIRETHAQLNVFADTEVEAHYRPGLIRDAFRNKKLQAFFASCEEECFSNRLKLQGDRLEICAPTQRFNAVHQMLHIYHHLFDGGIGLRQVMDYYFLTKSLNLDLNLNNDRVIEELGKARFEKAMKWVLLYVFEGKDREDGRKYGKMLLAHIMDGGNFGQHKAATVASRHTHFGRFINQLTHDIRLIRYYPGEAVWAPLSMIREFVRIRI